MGRRKFDTRKRAARSGQDRIRDSRQRTHISGRYHVVNRAIKRGEIEADPRMVAAITVAILVAATAVIAYMIISEESA
jgi:hypothetical protein